MKTIKKIALAIVTLSISSATFAQHKHEFSVYGQGGLSTLKYKTTFGKQKNGLGGGGGLGYTYFFSENFGLGTGAEVMFYNAKTDVSNLSDNYWIIDRDLQKGDYHYKLDKYTEKQKLMTVNVPLFLQFQTNGNTKFYATLGGKVAFPVKDRFEAKDSQITAWAYYPIWDQTLYDPREEGYGTFNKVNSKGDVDFKTAYMASAEAGVKWRLKENMSLYTGAYIDYGFNNIKHSANDKQFMEPYNVLAPADFKTNSVMESNYASNGKLGQFTDKVNLMAAGLKIKLAFGAGKTNKAEAPIRIEPRPVPVTPPAVSHEAEEARRRAEEEARRQAEESRRKAEAEAIQVAKDKEIQKVKEDIAFTLDHFQLGKSMLTADIRAIVDARVDALRKHPELKITVTGHTCNIDTPKKNLEVGLKRANEVKAYMVGKGISETRITTVTKGHTEPVVPNTNNANRLKNRRVEVVAQ